MLSKASLKQFRNRWFQNFTEFFENSSIHGLKYVSGRNTNIMQRIYFSISVLSVMLLACYFAIDIYAKWQLNPIIFGIDPEPTFVTNEPFPAVTICNMNPVMKARVNYFSNDSLDDLKLQFLCKFNRDINQIPEAVFDGDDLIEFLTNVSQPCEDMIIYCVFGGVQLNCSEVFQLIVTSQGVCCVFNMLHPKFMYSSRIPTALHNFAMGNITPVNWSPESGYEENLPYLFFPRKTHGTGESLGFQVTLDAQNDNFYCSSSYSIGFKILMHNPMETPNAEQMGVLISTARQTKIRIRPEKVRASSNLRKIDRNYRYCLFDGELKLKYFAHYSQRNCELECISRVMFRYCGCITFYLPLIYNHSPICGSNKWQCVQKVELRSDKNIEFCLNLCWPSCSDLTFWADVSTAFLRNVDAETEKRNLSSKYISENIAIVNMYYKDYVFRSTTQTELYGTVDFISDIGGLISLFIGFSLISILEIIYFIVLRPIQRLVKFKTLEKNIEKRKSSTKTLKTKMRKRNLQRRQLKQAVWSEFAHNSFGTAAISLKNQRKELFIREQIPVKVWKDVLDSIN